MMTNKGLADAKPDSGEGVAESGTPGRWVRYRPRTQWQADLCAVLGTSALVIVLGIAVPYIVTPVLLGVFVFAICYGLFAMGTNVLVGWSGLITFAQAAFFGAGGYCVALLGNVTVAPPVKLLIAAGVTSCPGLLLSLGLARFLHITFAILTLVVGQLVYVAAFRSPLVGGENGLAPVPRGSVAGFSIESGVSFWVYAVVVLGVVGVLYWRLHSSMFGLRVMAMRDDEIRGSSLGLGTVALRGVAGAVAAGIAGIGGGLYAQYAGAVSPTLLYFDLAGVAIFMCLLGGSGFLWGPLVGGVVYGIGARYFLQSTSHPDMYIGIAFMIIIVLLPGGLLSIRSRFLATRRRRHEHP
jgi:branched-chain amino acid transport system permease protein